MKTATAPLPPLRSFRFLDQLRERIRYLHYSLRTEQAYVTGSCFIRFHGVRHRQPWAAAKSSISVWLANERKVRSPRIVRHWRPCCSSTARCCARICPGFRRSEDLAVAALAVVLTRMKWFASSVFWKASIVCSPSFCMERACGSVRVCNCGSRIWISITARSSCGRARAPRIGLDVTESLAPSLREQLSRARAWWLKDQARAAAALRFPTP